MTEIWEYIESTSSPPKRCGHKQASILGDTFLIFGGKNEDGYLNDIHLYNFMSNDWLDLTGTSPIQPRAYTCIYLEYPLLYIHGGINNQGVISDFWTFNIQSSEYTLLPSKGQSPSLAYHDCFIDEDNLFIAYSGSSSNGKSNPNVYSYKISTGTWEIILSSDLFAISSTAVLLMEDLLLFIGGSRHTEAQTSIIAFNSTDIFVLGELPIAVVSHEAVHAGRSIYVYGGDYTIDKVFLPKKGSTTFIKVTSDVFSCSEGFFGYDCDICPMGTYNFIMNSLKCLDCSPGTYSENYGLVSPSQCLPCPYGTYTDEYGSTYCYDCALKEECKFKSINQKYKPSIQSIVSVQPDAFDTNYGEAEAINSYLQYTIVPVIFIILVLYILFKNSNFYKKFDIYKERHKRKFDQEPFATSHGAFFSYIFIALMILLILTPTVLFFLSNIRETKTLVPSFTLQNSEYVSEYSEIDITLHDFASDCSNNNGTCEFLIDIVSEGISNTIYIGPTCKDLGNSICKISFKFEKTSFSSISSLNFTITDVSVYTTGIEVEAKSSTSMPGRYNESSVKIYTEPPDNYVFNGIRPTIFYISLTPTVKVIQIFYSESSKWASNVTGYHVSSTQKTVSGSTSNSLQ